MKAFGALLRLRTSGPALMLATLAWASGCGAARPMIEPSFASRTYTPARIAVLPPQVFMVYDEVGDNDPQKSLQLGQAVTQETVQLIAGELQRRGYDVNLSARWDGIYDGNGQLLVHGNDLGWLGSSIAQFASSDAGGGQGPITTPAFIAPELAQRVGWATGSDALLYVNMKGVVVSDGKRVAQVAGVVFFALVVVAIVALLMAQSKGNGGGHQSLPGGGASAPRTAPRANGWSAPPGRSVAQGGPTGAVVVPRGHGSYSSSGRGPVYRSAGPNVSVGLGVFVPVPIDGPQYTHEGQVADDDESFSGDQIHVSMTLVSAYDGRVLWHVRDSVDVEADKPQEVQGFVHQFMEQIPRSLSAPAAPPR